MNNKKTLMAAIFAIASLNAFSLEGSIKTGTDINAKFKPTYTDEGEKDRNIAFDVAGYDLTIADLKLNITKDIDIFATLKSSRVSADINDYNNLTLPSDDRINHDIMAKIGGDANFNITKDLRLENSITYYVDNFWDKKTKDKDGKVTESQKSEYVEGDKTNALGNLILSSKLKGKVKNTDLDMSLKYKSNQLVRFDKDESYFKIDASTKSKINDKLNVNSNYNFYIDLNQMSKPFNSFEVDYPEYPDYMVGDYVTYFTQHADVETDYNKDEKLEFSNNTYIDQTAFYAAGNKPKSKNRTYYNILTPGTSLSITKKVPVVVGDLVFKNNIIGEFKVKDTKYYADKGLVDRHELVASFNPGFKTEFGYELDKKDDINVNVNLTGEYKPSVLFYPEVQTEDSIVHDTVFTLDSKIEKNFNKDEKLTFNTENKVDTYFKKEKKVDDISVDSKLNLDYENKVNDKLEVKASASNDFTIKLRAKSRMYRTNSGLLDLESYKTVYPNIMTDKGKLLVEGTYKFLDLDKEKLSLDSKLTYKHSSGYSYVLRDPKKAIVFSLAPNSKENNEESVREQNEEYRKQYGKMLNTYNINSVVLENTLDYENLKFDKLEINPSLSMKSQFDTLIIRNEKIRHYNNEAIEKTKELPKTSDDLHTNVNYGGSVTITPSVDVTYKPMDKLELGANAEISALFEKKILDIITDKDRPDNGQFNAIDKNFDFRELTPKVGFSLKYSW